VVPAAYLQGHRDRPSLVLALRVLQVHQILALVRVLLVLSWVRALLVLSSVLDHQVRLALALVLVHLVLLELSSGGRLSLVHQAPSCQEVHQVPSYQEGHRDPIYQGVLPSWDLPFPGDLHVHDHVPLDCREYCRKAQNTA